jgi:hypothetical protein
MKSVIFRIRLDYVIDHTTLRSSQQPCNQTFTLKSIGHSLKPIMEHPRDAFHLKYRPLDNDKNEIRLVALFPGDEDSIVTCTFEYESLINPPEFCALSYYCKLSTRFSSFISSLLRILDSSLPGVVRRERLTGESS